MWMNEGEINQAVERFATHPVLGKGARFLAAFRDEVNAHSDGWPYWKLPAQAADKLMTLLHGHLFAGMGAYPRLPEATEAELKKALSPIKAFYTRRGYAAGMQLPTLEAKPANGNKVVGIEQQLAAGWTVEKELAAQERGRMMRETILTERTDKGRMSEHEALAMALEMMQQITEGRQYDALEFHRRMDAIRVTWQKEQDLIECDKFANR